jgi:predicted dehydrogenase
MLRPLVVGLGRSGAGLHLKALARATARDGHALAARPPVGCDPRPGAGRGLTGVTVTTSVTEAARLTPPETTVVHVCTPPADRLQVLTELAGLGFTRMIVEKPLASGPAELARIDALRRHHGLDLTVVSHWLTARLTQELRLLLAGGRLGALRTIDAAQHKPRFHRSFAGRDHATAFDVELPHSLGVVLDLAGPADVVDARCGDMVCEDALLPAMGTAVLRLRHRSGVRTRLVSDLTSPVRRRSLTLRFTHGTATAHYPISETDDHAQLVLTGAVDGHRIFRDDALTVFMRRTYQRFAEGREADFALHHQVARLLCEARNRSGAGDPAAADPARAARREADARAV